MKYRINSDSLTYSYMKKVFDNNTNEVIHDNIDDITVIRMWETITGRQCINKDIPALIADIRTSLINYSSRCDQCIFGIYYSSSGILTRLCAADSYTDEQARVAILNSNSCSNYEEGNMLYLEWNGRDEERFNLPANDKYLVDRRQFSKEPVARCVSFNGKPNEHCSSMANGMCYYIQKCSSKAKFL